MFVAECDGYCVAAFLSAGAPPVAGGAQGDGCDEQQGGEREAGVGAWHEVLSGLKAGAL